MEGSYNNYPSNGGYPKNNPRNLQYQNQYNSTSSSSEPLKLQSQPLYHPQQPQQYSHQSYQSSNVPLPQNQPQQQFHHSYLDQQPIGNRQYYPTGYQTNSYSQHSNPQLHQLLQSQGSEEMPLRKVESLEGAKNQITQPLESKPPPKPIPHVNIKTKFPVARIKRIMQADEDVGKVAQVTPVIVSKALELFMVSLVTKAADEARSRNSKRITAAHLKQAVVKEDQFDFLAEVISKAPDFPQAGDEGGNGSGKSGRVASGGTSEEFSQAPPNMNNIIEEDGGNPTTKRSRRGRKKKASSDDEF